MAVDLVNKKINFMAKKEWFKGKFKNWLFRSLGAIPVDREKPDFASIKACLKVLKDDKPLVVFPEGTRNFYIRNQFGEELRVTVEIKNEQKTDNDELSSGESLQKGGCKSSVSAFPLTGAGCLFALAVALKKSGGKDEKTEE